MNDRPLMALPMGIAAYLGTYLVLTLAAAAFAGGRDVLRPLLWIVVFVSGVAGGAAAARRAGTDVERREVFPVALGATAGVTALIALATYVAGGVDVVAALGGVLVAACGAIGGVFVVRPKVSR